MDNLRIPPHSVEAEQSVLGGLMLDASAWDKLDGKVVSDYFYRHDHRLIFRAMENLIASDSPVDAVTVIDRLKSDGQLEKVGGWEYVGGLVKSIPGAANITAYATIVRDSAILRQLTQAGAEIATACYEAKGRSSLDVLLEAEKKIFSIAELGRSLSSESKQGPELIGDVLVRTKDNIEQLAESGDSVTGLRSGFDELDKLTSGFHPGDLIVIAGRPAMGKTTFAMNIAEHVGVEGGNVLVFSMEMPSEQLAVRMLSSTGRVKLQDLRTGRVKDEDWARISSSLMLLDAKKILVDDKGGLSPTEMRSRAMRAAKDYGALDLIVVDYLQLMQIPGSRENRAAEISQVSRSLKELAKDLKVPVVVLSQLNRGLESRVDKRPMMSDLRESGAIEQDADLIAFIYRDEVYNSETAAKGEAEIIIGKQRNGPTDTVNLNFEGQYSRFDVKQSKPFS